MSVDERGDRPLRQGQPGEPWVRVEATITVELAMPFSVATRGWTDKERTELLNGEDEAKRELLDEQVKEAYETGFGWDQDGDVRLGTESTFRTGACA